LSLVNARGRLLGVGTLAIGHFNSDSTLPSFRGVFGQDSSDMVSSQAQSAAQRMSEMLIVTSIAAFVLVYANITTRTL